MNAITAEILIKGYYESYPQVDISIISNEDGYNYLLKYGLIEKVKPKLPRPAVLLPYRTTEKGSFLVEYWLETPLPTEIIKWEINREK